jgi:cytochrome b-561
MSSRPSFFHHLHPPTIPAAQAHWRYTLGAGGLAVFLVLVVVITGALELFYYVPTPAGAAESVQTLTFRVPYGGLVRSLHYWAAQLLVAVTLLHLLRVVFTGATVRRFNYLLGLVLLVLIVLLDFSGYVLRWDEDIRWALVAGTNLLSTVPIAGDALYRFVMGGDLPGGPALVRFYAWHIFGLTLALVVIGAWHVFRVRRDGGVVAPARAGRAPGADARIARSELVRREALAAVLGLLALLLLAILWPAPIAPPITVQTALTTAGAVARAPWFFRWVQELLRLGDAFLMGVAAPLAVLAVLAAAPFVFPAARPEERGRWFPRSGRALQVVVALLLVAVLALTLIEYQP